MKLLNLLEVISINFSQTLLINLIYSVFKRKHIVGSKITEIRYVKQYIRPKIYYFYFD